MQPWPDEVALVSALRAGDEDAFAGLLQAWSRSMVRVARSYVSTDASAQEVVQDTWLAVIRGLDGFQGRSSLRTWVYRILVNTAKRRGVRESRTVPWTSLGPSDADGGPTVDPAAFRGPGDAYPGGWRVFPAPWHADAIATSTERTVLARETGRQVNAALDRIPERQRVVVTLRDVLGHTPDEVCEMLEISAANQRVLLHRGRARIRAMLDDALPGLRPEGRADG